jgi:two-component system OmpR family sensor kinase/two-component system sensor histidine kinase BaeS
VNRLWVKLSAAFFLVSLAAIGVVALFSLRATGSEFRQYVVASGMGNQAANVAALAQYYAMRGSWEGVEGLLQELGPGMMGMGMGRGWQGGGSGDSAGHMMNGPNFAVVDPAGRVVASRTGELVGETLPEDALSQAAAVVVGGELVGGLLNVRPADAALDAQAELFLSRVRTSLLWAAAGAAALSLVLGILLSRLLTAPLSELTRASRAVAAGDLTQRVEIRSQDETGELGRAFNDMAASLAAAETQRKNLIADVSHELRTPLTVVQGDLQAILDGVYPLEMGQIASLYDETRLLTRLVDDLHDLALADAGQLRIERLPVDVGELARAAAAQFAPVGEAQGVRVSVSAEDGLPSVSGDADRLAQVLRNLLGNALRHTAAGGSVVIGARQVAGAVELSVADTGAGITPEDLPHVFDRFYRGDKRARGAGLGLAIARQLVMAHGGEIAVESEVGRGTRFTMRLPQMSREL